MSYVMGFDDLQSSVAAMAQLTAQALSLEQTMTRVAEFAVTAIPGAEGAGVTLIEAGRHDTIVASATFVADVDAIQYGIGEGPCISAAVGRTTVRSGSLGTESRWPAFGPRVEQIGVHSVLSLPLLLSDETLPAVGAINVYARPRDAFDDRAQELGELFAVPAALAVRSAQILAASRRATALLQSALPRQAMIDRAIGILMSRHGGNAEQAFAALTAISEQNNEHIADSARNLIEQAGRHDQAGDHRQPPNP
jgi:hypothetical protein